MVVSIPDDYILYCLDGDTDGLAMMDSYDLVGATRSSVPLVQQHAVWHLPNGSVTSDSIARCTVPSQLIPPRDSMITIEYWCEAYGRVVRGSKRVTIRYSYTES